jgi:hypothetical protein
LRVQDAFPAVWLDPCTAAQATKDTSTVLGPSAYGDYFVNEDRSIWPSPAWATNTEMGINVAEEWIKVGWFRPAGAELVVKST